MNPEEKDHRRHTTYQDSCDYCRTRRDGIQPPKRPPYDSPLTRLLDGKRHN